MIVPTDQNFPGTERNLQNDFLVRVAPILTHCPYIYLLFFFRELQLLVVELCSIPQTDSNFPADGINSHF